MEFLEKCRDPRYLCNDLTSLDQMAYLILESWRMSSKKSLTKFHSHQIKWTKVNKVFVSWHPFWGFSRTRRTLRRCPRRSLRSPELQQKRRSWGGGYSLWNILVLQAFLLNVRCLWGKQIPCCCSSSYSPSIRILSQMRHFHQNSSKTNLKVI